MCSGREMGDELRKCGRCGEAKPVDDFARRRIERGQRDNMCRPCRSEYGKEHYAANRGHYIDEEARRKQAKAEVRMAFLVGSERTYNRHERGRGVNGCTRPFQGRRTGSIPVARLASSVRRWS